MSTQVVTEVNHLGRVYIERGEEDQRQNNVMPTFKVHMEEEEPSKRPRKNVC